MLKKQKFLLSIVFIIGCTYSCGRGGDGNGGGGGVKPEPPDPPKPNNLHTSVGIHANDHKRLDVSPCFRYTDYALPAVEDTFSLDGRLADWAKTPVLLSDPVGDASSVIDLSHVQIGRQENGVALALAFVEHSETSVFVEIGGVLSRDNQIHSEVKHFIKINPAQSQELTATGWVDIGNGLIATARGDGGIEIVLSDRLIGDTVTWPAWWIRVVTQNSSSLKWDSTHAAYFPSVLGGDALPFTFAKCTQWNGDLASVSQLMITHNIPTPANPSPDYVADGAFDIRREHALQLGRYALDLSLSLADQLPYTSSVNTIFVSDIAPEGAFQPKTLRHPLIDAGQTYRAMGLNTKNMGFRPDTYFPQGLVIDRSVSFHMTHMLLANFQTMGLGSVEATAHALTHHFKKKYLSEQYWYDHRWPQISTFLATTDTESPRSLDALLGEASSISGDNKNRKIAFYQAKMRAASHLLGEYFSADEVVQAWKEATRNTSSSMPSEAAAILFLTDLFALLPADDTRKTLQHMFDGYLISGSYDPRFIPTVHDDRDFDGLPQFMEQRLGTSDELSDSDGDGWSDLVEHTGGFDPKSVTQFPGLIVADGNFSEWQNLLASKIIIDKGHSGVCEKDADIQFYAAIADRDHLIIGAVAGDFWINESKARWEVVVDLPAEKRTLLIVAPNKERIVTISDQVDNKLLMIYPQAVPAGGKVAEILVDRIAMRLNTPFNREQGIRLRLRTTYETEEGPVFCDETNWFEPFIK